MSVKVIDKTDQIRNQTRQRASVFLRLTCENVVDIARPITPKDKGNLKNDVLKTVNGLHAEIEWRKVYASYQERGSRADGSRVVRNYTTPGTSKGFAKKGIDQAVDKTQVTAKLAHLI